jgi:hypothetical protein
MNDTPSDPSGYIIIGILVGIIFYGIILLIFYNIIRSAAKSALNNSMIYQLNTSVSSILALEKNDRVDRESSSIDIHHLDIVQILYLLRKAAIVSIEEIILYTGIKEDSILKGINFLVKQNLISISENSYFITDRGLVWINNFNFSRPMIHITLKDYMGLLQCVFMNFKYSSFEISSLLSINQKRFNVIACIKWLATNGYLIPSNAKSPNEYSEHATYHLNPEKEAVYISLFGKDEKTAIE